MSVWFVMILASFYRFSCFTGLGNRVSVDIHALEHLESSGTKVFFVEISYFTHAWEGTKKQIFVNFIGFFILNRFTVISA